MYLNSAGYDINADTPKQILIVFHIGLFLASKLGTLVQKKNIES